MSIHFWRKIMRKFKKREIMTFLLVVMLLGITLKNSLLLFRGESLPDQTEYREETKSLPKSSAQSVSPTLLSHM